MVESLQAQAANAPQIIVYVQEGAASGLVAALRANGFTPFVDSRGWVDTDMVRSSNGFVVYSDGEQRLAGLCKDFSGGAIEALHWYPEDLSDNELKFLMHYFKGLYGAKVSDLPETGDYYRLSEQGCCAPVPITTPRVYSDMLGNKIEVGADNTITVHPAAPNDFEQGKGNEKVLEHPDK